MIVALLIFAMLLIVTGVRGTYRDLFNALGQDLPPFMIWAAAIIGVGAVGFVPGLKPVSRGLLALVIVVLVINNYDKILKGFNDAWQNVPANQPPPSQNAGTNSPGDVASSLPSSLSDIVEII